MHLLPMLLPTLLPSLLLASGLKFAPAPDSPVLVGPMAGRPALGDVDGDGTPDLVVACGTCCGDQPDPKSGHLVVLLNDGKGRFAWAKGSPLKIGSSVRKVALGDVDGDGRLDVVAAEHDSYAITVLLGDGQGAFKPAPTSPVASGAGPRPHTHEVALADVDRDGKLDLLATHVDDSKVAVLRGDGKGGFTPAPGSPIAVSRGPYDALVVRDLDGDRHPDFAVPCIHGNVVDVFAGDGKGGFARMPGAPIRVGDRPGYVGAADVDLDGAPELLVTHDDVGLLAVLRNQTPASGSAGAAEGAAACFAPAPGSPFRLSKMAWGFAAGDLDGDGFGDVVLGAMSQEGGAAKSTPMVLLGDAEGNLAETAAEGLPAGASLHYMLLGDVDRDGKLDVIASDYARGEIAIALQR